MTGRDDRQGSSTASETLRSASVRSDAALASAVELDRTQAELTSLRNRCAELYERAPVAYLTVDRDRVILEANRAAYRLLGRNPPELLGKNCGAFVDAHDRARSLSVCEEAWAQGYAHSDEIRLRLPTGSIVWARFSASVSSAAETPSLHIAITEVAQAELDLRENEKQLRLITNRIPGPISRISRELRYLFVNDHYETFFGKPRGALLGKRMPDVLGPDVFRFVEPYVQRALQGEAVSFEVQLRGQAIEPAYSLTHYIPDRDAEGDVVGFFVVAVDITERKKAEDTLRIADLALKAVSQGVLITSREHGISWVNDAYLEITGYTRDEVMGQQCCHIMGPLTDAETRSKVAAALETNGSLSCELLCYRKDGSTFWDELTISPVPGAPGQASRFIAVTRDVTERKRAEEERRKLATQLQRAQKLESIGRLAGGVAHDFNNMLGVILGNVELSLEEVVPGSTLHENLVEIDRAARHSAEFTRQLLAFARKQVVAPKVLDLNATLTPMLRMLQRLMGEDIQVVFEPAEHLWQVRMDPSQIEQILTSLSANARDAIRDVGKLSIETENVEIDEAYCIDQTDAVPGQYVRLTMHDTGHGMSPETLARVFEPFFTTKDFGAGTGLGLATVYGAVRQNDGFISVTSAPAKGTRFEIHLPRYRGEAPARPPSTQTEEPAPKATILLVEDEAAMLRLARTLLLRQGYQVLAADNAEAALQMAREHREGIDLLLTDVVMPNMNGRALADAVLALHPGIECLFMSGHTADVIVQRGVAEQGGQLLEKPFSGTELLARVARLLRSRAERA